MMFTTYTKEDISELNRNTQHTLVETSEDDLVNRYQLDQVVDWINKNNFQRTCLQFPENLLNDGTSIAIYLQEKLGKVVYVLADTSYGSCCVDEVAAEHIDGDSVVHFGHACLSPVVKLPVLYVFEKRELSLEKLRDQFQTFCNTDVVVFYSDVFHHLHSQLCNLFEKHSNVYISRLQMNENDVDYSKEKVICGRIFSKTLETNVTALYIGDESITLQNLYLGLPDFKWYRFSTEEEKIEEYHMNRNKFLMQRSHLVEKIKEGKVIGILIGTLGIKNYLDAVERVKNLVKKKGKKCYILAVGKPNVAKLANFPEIDVFVCISCQENSLLKNYKDYYKPIVGLFEVEMALGDHSYSVEYTSDFRELLPGGLFYKESEPEVDSKTSLGSGETSQELMEKQDGTLIELAGSQFLSSRTWQGLQQNIGKTEVSKAVKGRAGIPQHYNNELNTLSE